MGKIQTESQPFYQKDGWDKEDECPHRHFKGRPIDRDLLTRKQHLNLLCTPRGYRWEVAYVLEHEDPKFKLPEMVSQGAKPSRTYVYNILADLLVLLTPQMLERIRDMLVNEFSLSSAEAEEFICLQVKDIFEKAVPPHLRTEENKVDPSNRTCQLRPNPIRIDMCKVKYVCKAASDKVAQIAFMSMSGKRSKRHKTLTEVFHTRLCEMTQDHFEYHNPRTVLERAQVFLIDRMALWICENIQDEEADERKLRELEDARAKKTERDKQKEREDRQKERERLLRAIARKKEATEATTAEAKRKEEDEKQKREEERKRKHEEWLKKDAENKKEEEARRKEERSKMKDEAAKKRDKIEQGKQEQGKRNEELRTKNKKAKQAAVRSQKVNKEKNTNKPNPSSVGKKKYLKDAASQSEIRVNPNK